MTSLLTSTFTFNRTMHSNLMILGRVTSHLWNLWRQTYKWSLSFLMCSLSSFTAQYANYRAAFSQSECEFWTTGIIINNYRARLSPISKLLGAVTSYWARRSRAQYDVTKSNNFDIAAKSSPDNCFIIPTNKMETNAFWILRNSNGRNKGVEFPFF